MDFGIDVSKYPGKIKYKISQFLRQNIRVHFLNSNDIRDRGNLYEYVMFTDWTSPRSSFRQQTSTYRSISKLNQCRLQSCFINDNYF